MSGLVAVIDPTWPTEAGGGGRGAQNHYALASVDAMALAYRQSEPWRDTGPALLWMWTTGSAILAGDAHALARSLGFRPCAEWVWVKVDALDCAACSGTGAIEALNETWPCKTCDGGGKVIAPAARLGLGQWSRKEHEHLWLCKRGGVKPPPPEARARPRSVIYGKRRQHSAKPPEAWRVIETVSGAALPGALRVEWNARTQRAGWGAVGRLDGENAPIVYRNAGGL